MSHGGVSTKKELDTADRMSSELNEKQPVNAHAKERILGQIIFVQPALPTYRIDFFERLNAQYGKSLKVYYSPGSLGALTNPVSKEWAKQLPPFQSLPGGLAWQPKAASLQVNKADILVLSGNPRQLSTLVLLVKAKIKKAKTVWWGHYRSSTTRRWRQVLRFLPMAMADAILFYTDAEIEEFKNDRVALGKSGIVSALNNGIDITPVVRYRKKYNASERECALLFISRLTEKAKLDLAFQAIAELGDDAPHLHVIGSGAEEEPLKRLATHLGITEFVHWHGALTNEAQISSVANRCTAFLYPGVVGLSLIHAMAYGLPAIIHDDRLRQGPEIAAFGNGVTGINFENGDVGSLVRVLRAVMYDYVSLNRLSVNSLQRINGNYSTIGMARRFSCLIERLNMD